MIDKKIIDRLNEIAALYDELAAGQRADRSRLNSAAFQFAKHSRGPSNPGQCHVNFAEGCHLYIAVTKKPDNSCYGNSRPTGRNLGFDSSVRAGEVERWLQLVDLLHDLHCMGDSGLSVLTPFERDS